MRSTLKVLPEVSTGFRPNRVLAGQEPYASLLNLHRTPNFRALDGQANGQNSPYRTTLYPG